MSVMNACNSELVFRGFRVNCMVEKETEDEGECHWSDKHFLNTGKSQAQMNRDI